jgi:hypothetical protein
VHVFLGRFYQKFAVILSDVHSEEVEPLLNVRDAGFLWRELQTPVAQKLLDQWLDFIFQQFLGRAGDDEVVRISYEVHLGMTQEYHVEGPVMIFLTTTAIDLDEELQNRCLTLAVDESAEQTGRIHRVQRERRTLAGLVAHEERKDLLKQLRNAQRLLQPLHVVNPFAPALTFATARTRNRRDHEKYLTLIDAIALLHQHQREIKTLPAGQSGAGSACFIEVTLDDIALTNELAPEMLGRSLDELPPQTRLLLAHIRELMKTKRKERSAKAATTFSRRELRDTCGWSLTQVRVHLERLVDLEYLAVQHGRFGSQFVYEILFDLDAPEAVAHVGLIEIAKLRHDYKTNLTGFCRGVAGQNGHLAGGDETHPPPILANADRHLLHT